MGMSGSHTTKCWTYQMARVRSHLSTNPRSVRCIRSPQNELGNTWALCNPTDLGNISITTDKQWESYMYIHAQTCTQTHTKANLLVVERGVLFTVFLTTLNKSNLIWFTRSKQRMKGSCQRPMNWFIYNQLQ